MELALTDENMMKPSVKALLFYIALLRIYKERESEREKERGSLVSK